MVNTFFQTVPRIYIFKKIIYIYMYRKIVSSKSYTYVNHIKLTYVHNLVQS